MKNLIVHTPNYGEGIANPNIRFGNAYVGQYDNTDRLTIVGIPNEDTKELSIGVAFCTYPDNFDRNIGTKVATSRAGGYPFTKPYSVVQLDDFTMENCLQVLYDLHEDLVSRSVRGVKYLVATQIVK